MLCKVPEVKYKDLLSTQKNVYVSWTYPKIFLSHLACRADRPDVIKKFFPSNLLTPGVYFPPPDLNISYVRKT